jgi:lipopolysaccharide cholinephosphotransferase
MNIKKSLKPLSLSKIREIQLSMLNDFHNFCVKHNLRYFLDAGTLLGAIRYKGFIPWDNDVDVAMPRYDYNRFIELAKNGYGNSILLLPKDSIETYLKIIDKRTILIEHISKSKQREIGIYIDVYPKDGLKRINLPSRLKCFRVKLLNDFYWNITTFKCYFNSKPNFKKRLIYKMLIALYKNPNNILKRIDAISQQNSFDESPFVATIVSGGIKNAVKREYLSNYFLTSFENLNLYIPVNFHDYLLKLVGLDYMVPPPKEKQVTHHKYDAYMKD